MKMSSGNTELLAKGTLVEVTSDEEGFDGAWFLAKVLDTRSKEMNYLVEYQSLLFPDSNELLREFVPCKFVRPLPPLPISSSEGEQRFQVNDVVEAYHNDGWWVGVVSKVSKEEQQPRIYSVSFENPYHVLKFKSSQLRFHLDWNGHEWVQPQKLKKTISKGQEKRKEKKEAESSSRKRKRGRLVKSILEGKECDGAEDGVDKIPVKNSSTIGVESTIAGDSTEKVTELSDAVSKVQDAEMVNMITNKVNVDEDKSMCSPTIVVDLKAATVDDMSFENPNLQFLDSSPVLKVVRSMEEFQLMPQKPHFRPFDECEEVRREGLVLAYMMTFVNVVKETSKLQADSSRSKLDSLLECLLELESHGFVVKDVRSRLLKLQSMKRTREELQTKMEKAECEITKRTCNGRKMKEELDDAIKEIKMLEEKIKEAEEKRTRLTLINEENASVIAKLESSNDLLNEDIQNLEHKFESLVASPWR